MLTKHHERDAAQGLNVAAYYGKWTVAKHLAFDEREYPDSRHLLPYWERVRLFYLELGGEYLDPHHGPRQ